MSTYSRINPYTTYIKARYPLTKEDSTKQTWHIELLLPAQELPYRPGDSIAVLPKNQCKEVDAIIQFLNWQKEKIVYDSRHKKERTIENWLLRGVSLATINLSLFEELYLQAPKLYRDDLELNKSRWSREELVHWLSQFTFREFIEEFHIKELDAEKVLSRMTPLLPRFYSISSCQKHVGDEVHLTVVHVAYTHNNKPRFGVCSHFLCKDADVLHTPIDLYIHPTRDFLLPEQATKKIIMIGPGTGIAPFRAFMQRRAEESAPSSNWLFFGERNRARDFYYESFWNNLVEKELLKISTAFSRDTDAKIYVQDRLWQERDEVWKWIEDGAYLYICGDAKHMAKDVENCLLRMIQTKKEVSEEEALNYLSTMRKEKRYLRDVY